MLSIFFKLHQKRLKQSSKSLPLSTYLSISFSNFSLLTTPLWNVSIEDKLKLSSIRLSNICERLITTSINSYKFPPSPLLLISQTNFGNVDWWKITTTDPQDDEVNKKNSQTKFIFLPFFLDPDDTISSTT
jgi:hypothetical protein